MKTTSRHGNVGLGPQPTDNHDLQYNRSLAGSIPFTVRLGSVLAGMADLLLPRRYIRLCFRSSTGSILDLLEQEKAHIQKQIVKTGG
ncbi:unnamed protein product [Ranitomeya imitator]|uniref:Uncharacterized protein n=1 Tax=Ranitomeya imitator TaxID=111125 RepID=A0ABN9MMS7_9NEOB|nr:unnamed protein product [Ranitomeya imitator]